MSAITQSHITIEFPLTPAAFQDILVSNINIWEWISDYLRKLNERSYLRKNKLSLTDYHIYLACICEVSQRWGNYSNERLSKEDRRLSREHYNQIAQILDYTHWSKSDKKRLPSEIEFNINIWTWIERRVTLGIDQYYKGDNLILNLFLAELLRIWSCHSTRDYRYLAKEQYNLICKQIEEYTRTYYVFNNTHQRLNTSRIPDIEEIESDAIEVYLPLPPSYTLDPEYFVVEDDQLTDDLLPTSDYIEKLAANLVFLPMPPAYVFYIPPVNQKK